MENNGNIVKDYYSGNTHIKVADDYYRDKTQADIDRILNDIAKIVKRSIKNATTK
ncbi:MAG: hypothetical protein IKG98_12295 [Ruminococcus sp.]|nr:hypothetical protein [Ruminococcus sp.]